MRCKVCLELLLSFSDFNDIFITLTVVNHLNLSNYESLSYWYLLNIFVILLKMLLCETKVISLASFPSNLFRLNVLHVLCQQIWSRKRNGVRSPLQSNLGRCPCGSNALQRLHVRQGKPILWHGRRWTLWRRFWHLADCRQTWS